MFKALIDIINENTEKGRAQNRSLNDAAGNREGIGIGIADTNSLKAIGEKIVNPI